MSSSSAAARPAPPSRPCSPSTGYSVQLFERERFPRFHIGESLIPETYWVLEAAQHAAKMKKSHFVKKFSVQFVNAAGKLSAPVLLPRQQAARVLADLAGRPQRVRQMMLDNAREHGVEVHEGVRVLDVLFERRPGGRRDDSDAKAARAREVRAKVVVDASGQNGLLQNRFKLRLWDPVLNKGAIWTYWKGAYRDTGRDEGATMVIQTTNKQGWLWYIPQHDDIVSVGVVGPFDYLFKGRGSHEQTYNEEVERCPAVQGARRQRHPRDRLLRHEGLLVPLEAGGRRRLGADRRRLRLPRPALLVRRAAGAEVGRAGRRRHRRGPGEGRHLGGAARQVGPGVQQGRGPHAPAGVRVLRRLQLRQLRPQLSRT